MIFFLRSEDLCRYLKFIKEINLKLLKEKNEVKENKGQTGDYLYIYIAKVIPVTTLNSINLTKKKIQYNFKKKTENVTITDNTKLCAGT